MGRRHHQFRHSPIARPVWSLGLHLVFMFFLKQQLSTVTIFPDQDPDSLMVLSAHVRLTLVQLTRN
jgi:hypothetical protein